MERTLNGMDWVGGNRMGSNPFSPKEHIVKMCVLKEKKINAQAQNKGSLGSQMGDAA